MVSDGVPSRHATSRFVAVARSPYDEAMTVYIDDEPVDLAGVDLGTMLQEARRRMESLGRIVVEVELDGQRLDPSDLASRQQAPVADHSNLRLVTTDPHILASSTLHRIRGELETVRQEQIEAADLLQQDKKTQAVQHMASALDRWQQTQQAIGQATELIGIDLNSLTVGEQPVEAVMDGLICHLKALRGMLAARDTVALADALLYECPKTVDQWDQLLIAMIDAIDRAANPGSEDCGTD